MSIHQDREDGYHIVNGKRVLYWQQGEWLEPIKNKGRYTGYLRVLPMQPKRINQVEPYKDFSTI